MTQAFIDTDVIIRYLTGDDAGKQAAAGDLFEQLDQGLITIAVPDTVIADAVHVLSSRRLYNIPRDEIYELLSPLLRLKHFKVENATNVLRALEIYATHNLDFGDALIIASMEHQNSQILYSYDKDFDRIDGITRQEP